MLDPKPLAAATTHDDIVRTMTGDGTCQRLHMRCRRASAESCRTAPRHRRRCRAA